jgi:hypothetical protein
MILDEHKYNSEAKKEKLKYANLHKKEQYKLNEKFD